MKSKKIEIIETGRMSKNEMDSSLGGVAYTGPCTMQNPQLVCNSTLYTTTTCAILATCFPKNWSCGHDVYLSECINVAYKVVSSTGNSSSTSLLTRS